MERIQGTPNQWEWQGSSVICAWNLHPKAFRQQRQCQQPLTADRALAKLEERALQEQPCQELLIHYKIHLETHSRLCCPERRGSVTSGWSRAAWPRPGKEDLWWLQQGWRSLAGRDWGCWGTSLSDRDPVKVWEEGWGCLKSQPPTFPFQPLKPRLSSIESAFPGWNWGEDRLSAPVESSTVQHPHPGGDGSGLWALDYFL